MSFAKRVKLTVAAFRILRSWRITTRERSLDTRYIERGIVTFVPDLGRVLEANIHPWYKHSAEPCDYVLHEVLHIVTRALTMRVLLPPRTSQRLEEWTVCDLCKVMGIKRGEMP